MGRRLPKYFTQQFLPELLFSGPQTILEKESLAEQLNEAWRLGAQELRETDLAETRLEVEKLDWRHYDAVVVKLPRAQFQGESEAAVLCYRRATREARAIYLEKSQKDYCLTSIDQEKTHHFHRALNEPSLQTFLAAARGLVGT